MKDCITVKKSRGLNGEIDMPGDKSITHRSVIIGSIASGDTTIRGYLPSEDCINTIKAFKALGIEIEREGEILRVSGRGRDGLKEPEDIIYLGNSGTSLRLLTGLLSGQSFFSTLTGDGSLRSRPMMRVIEPLREMGADIRGRRGGDRAPIAISGRRLHGITYSSPIPSAQVKSAIIFAGLYADGITSLSEPLRSRDHTERMLSYFGAEIKSKGLTIEIKGGTKLEGRYIDIPGDISSASFFIIGATIVKDSEILIRKTGINPTRRGIIDILKEMGGRIEIRNERELCGEPVADIYVRSSQLKGTVIGGELIPKTIDEFPILCIAASMADCETIIKDSSELRLKESDRISVMTNELKKMGVDIEEFPDGLKIKGGNPLKGAVVSSNGDHRVAMAMTIAGMAAEGETCVEGIRCIDTSFPSFIDILRGLSRD
ncbi:MAG: 3-phosphoshikimate 1-carboxyvinyltransferase [Nitrospirota bacterium]